MGLLTGINAPKGLMASGNPWYDESKLQAAIAAQGKGADGRTVLSEQTMLGLLKPISGLTYAPATSWVQSQGDSGDPITMEAPGGARDAQGNHYKQVGVDANGNPLVQFINGNGRGWNNPTGNAGKDFVQPTYSLGPDGSATPVSAGVNYDPSEWVDNGRDVAKVAAAMAATYFGGTALAGMGSGGGGALSGMDLAADAVLGSGNNIFTAGSALGGSPGGLLSGMDLAADAALGSGNNITTAAGSFGAPSSAVSGMDLAADAAPGSGNNITQAGSQLGFTPGAYQDPYANMAATTPNVSPKPSFMDALKGGGSGLLDWASANPGTIAQLGTMLGGGLLGGLGSGGDSGGGSYTPKSLGGNFQSSVTPQQMPMQQAPQSGGLLSAPQGQANSGLWQFLKNRGGS